MLLAILAAPSVAGVAALFIIQNWSEMRGGMKSNL
jgi:hypothetical protein